MISVLKKLFVTQNTPINGNEHQTEDQLDSENMNGVKDQNIEAMTSSKNQLNNYSQTIDKISDALSANNKELAAQYLLQVKSEDKLQILKELFARNLQLPQDYNKQANALRDLIDVSLNANCKISELTKAIKEYIESRIIYASNENRIDLTGILKELSSIPNQDLCFNELPKAKQQEILLKLSKLLKAEAIEYNKTSEMLEKVGIKVAKIDIDQIRALEVMIVKLEDAIKKESETHLANDIIQNHKESFNLEGLNKLKENLLTIIEHLNLNDLALISKNRELMIAKADEEQRLKTLNEALLNIKATVERFDKVMMS